jgi:hypothetical protein
MGEQTTKQVFEAFDEELSLDPVERDDAIERHHQITDVLDAAGLIATTFLQGSFARKTMRKPLKDVDMVIVIHDDYRDQWFGAGKGGPAAAMAAFEEAVLDKWPDARFDVDKQPAKALQVTFTDCKFTFDLVPSFEDHDSEDDVFIGNREDDGWERSNTRTLRNIITDRNQATKGVFVHQVRMAKACKDNITALKEIPSLAIESFCYTAITRKQPHAEALAAYFAHAADAVLKPVFDPTGVDELSADWTEADRHGYGTALAKAADQAAEAIGLAADGDHDAAVEIWHAVLGDPFPEPTPQTTEQALAALAGGSITSSGRAVTSQRGVESNRPARSWRTR